MSYSDHVLMHNHWHAHTCVYYIHILTATYMKYKVYTEVYQYNVYNVNGLQFRMHHMNDKALASVLQSVCVLFADTVHTHTSARDRMQVGLRQSSATALSKTGPSESPRTRPACLPGRPGCPAVSLWTGCGRLAADK